MAMQNMDTDHIAPQLRHLAVPLVDLVLDPHNARTHNGRNIASIKASLKRFGQRIPIVVQAQGMVVRAGNGRVLAMREQGRDCIAAVVVDESEAEAAAFALADNRAAELAEWDDEGLAAVLGELDGLVDIHDLGWDDEELEGLLGSFSVEPLDGLPDLTGEPSKFQQITFTLTNEQAELVKNAVSACKDDFEFGDTGNTNSNGNAITAICHAFLES